MTVILKFISGEFVESSKSETGSEAGLELVPGGSDGVATLTFNGDAGLITRRTASRQAESVCKSGFLLKSGERVGIGMELKIVDGDKLSDAHIREGHKYNR